MWHYCVGVSMGLALLCVGVSWRGLHVCGHVGWGAALLCVCVGVNMNMDVALLRVELVLMCGREWGGVLLYFV